MRYRLVLPILFSLTPLLCTLSHARDAKPAPEVVTIPAPPADGLAPTEREKLRLLEEGGAPSVAPPAPASSTPCERTGGRRDEIICVFTPLTSGVAVPAYPASPPSYYYHSYQQPVSYWSAAGVRSAPGDDWDLSLYMSEGAAPPCVETLVAYSNRSAGVDFVVGDYNHVGARQDYLSAERYSGGENGLLEWDDGADILMANGPPAVRTTGPDDVLEIWDIYLEAGGTYTFLLNSLGDVDLKLLLFRNPGSGASYGSRGTALWETTQTETYTAPAADWYGLVVINDNGGSGTYTIQAGTCTGSIALASGVSVATPAAHGHYRFDQTWHYWSAVGVRSDNLSANWDLASYLSPTGGSWPTCFSDLTGYSTQSFGRVDFVAADSNIDHAPLGTYYGHVYRTVGPGDARTVWDGGADLLAVNEHVTASTSAADVLKVWDIWLEQDVDYSVDLARSGADVKVVVIPPNQGDWAARIDGLVDTGGPCGRFIPRSTGYHAAIMVNDDGASGTYDFTVAEQLVEATPPVLADAQDTREVSFADYDNDGDPDLYVTNYGPAPNRLFRNDGAWSFSDVTTPVLAHAAGNDTDGIWGDYDNDGDLDLYVVNNTGPNALLRNDGNGAFTDVTTPPLDDTGLGQTASWADYDRDGRIDLFLANGGATDRLFHNEGGGVFTDATPAAVGPGTTLAGIWGDYDGDGDADLYLVRHGSGKLLRNDQGSFVDVTTGPLGDSVYGMCGCWVDYDGDLDLDLFIGAWSSNILLRNDGNGVFAVATTPELAYGTQSRVMAWEDYNNDGLFDVFLPNWEGANRLLRDQSPTGEYVEALSASLAGQDKTAGVSFGDVDGDGDLDLYLGQAQGGPSSANLLIQNGLCSDRRWLEVRLVGVCSNRFGIGARITVTAATYFQMREVAGQAGGCSYVSHFGLWDRDYADEIEIRWPSGVVQTLYAVAANQVLTVVEDDCSTIGVEAEDEVPGHLVLHPIAPNPFRPATTIRYDLPSPSAVRLAIYDAAGRLIRVLVAEELRPAGRHQAIWDGREDDGATAATGIYFARLAAGDQVLTRKMTVLR